MKKTNIVLLALALMSQYSMAVCEVDRVTPEKGTEPTTLEVPAQVIRVDADAPVGTMIATYESNPSTLVSFINCVPDVSRYGKSVNGLADASQADRTFLTNIDGVVIKPRWSNTAAIGQFPSTAIVKEQRFNYPAGSKFITEYYKTKPRLSLKNPESPGDIVLPGGFIAYNWIEINDPSNYGQKLNIGQVTIISTPVCRIDGEKTVDFNTVSSSDIERGVTRPLDFSLTCATDYGDYTASASLTTQTPSADSKFIQVTDNAGNADRLKIRIDSSTGTHLLLDGSNGESKSSTDDIAAQFNWRATLLRDSATDLPASGQFNATAEIVLLVN
ncbi:fimbrial protein [Serratia sp. UGAL515B_01]|uniref:fimbrial protein n=1 Tax=Serratia sp. UGAL515B_01 TaxID=2986763 RepID=UPI0029532331|nr:fimbrial protein [Serratia sp. UGAL515B_01]WON77474.1 fimbrial protein [Serratia sp. UGAL515B_01]